MCQLQNTFNLMYFIFICVDTTTAAPNLFKALRISVIYQNAYLYILLYCFLPALQSTECRIMIGKLEGENNYNPKVILRQYTRNVVN